MTARLFAFVIWAALAASVVAWSLRLGSGSRPVPGHTVVVADSGAGSADLTRLLGSESPAAVAEAPAATPSSSRLKLLGVVAAARSEPAGRNGLALIAIDGKPARPYRIGGTVEQDLVLLEVRQRSASLGPPSGPASVKLELPPLASAATGTRPMAVNGGGGVPAAIPMRPQMAPPPPPMPVTPVEEEMIQAPPAPEAPDTDNEVIEPAPMPSVSGQLPPAAGKRGLGRAN